MTARFAKLVFYSPALDRETSYSTYLPPGYSTEGRSYPVLYPVHGGGGSKDEWTAHGLVEERRPLN